MGKKIVLELEEDGGVAVEFEEGLDFKDIAWMLRVANEDFSMQMVENFRTKMEFHLGPDEEQKE